MREENSEFGWEPGINERMNRRVMERSSKHSTSHGWHSPHTPTVPEVVCYNGLLSEADRWVRPELRGPGPYITNIIIIA